MIHTFSRIEAGIYDPLERLKQQPEGGYFELHVLTCYSFIDTNGQLVVGLKVALQSLSIWS